MGRRRGRDQAALLDYVGSRRQVPYAWGREANDCVGFALGAVEALTGTRPAPELDWDSEREGLEIIAGLGGLEAAFDRYFQRIAPAKALRGDIAGVPDERFGIHPMIVEGEMLVCPGGKGLRRCKRLHMIAAWSATDE